jgi:hypothetical protein
MVYIAKKGNEAVFHTDLRAMRDFDGIETPELTLTEEEFEAAGSLVRVIDGTLVLGNSDAELNAEKACRRLREIDAELQSIDAKSGRPARAVAAAIAKGLPPDPADVPRLEEYDQRSASLRSELNTVQSGVAG